MGLGHTLGEFGNGGRRGVGGRACDSQADGKGKRDNDGGEMHGDDDNKWGGWLHPKSKELGSLDSVSGPLLYLDRETRL